ncbi:hypothetical protein BHM03_00052053 [Ensete ventricosum]|nr:hypothetical protein BHM03_00052053 [Ensete ventricosum]
MPKVPTGKLGLAARATMSSPEVQEVPTEAALSVDAPTPKRLAEGSIPPLVGSSHAHKRVKVTVGKHKSRRGDGSSRAYCCIGWGDRATRVSLPQVNEGAVRDNARVWDDPQVATKFGRAVLHPQLAKELYSLLFEVLLARRATTVEQHAANLRAKNKKMLAELAEVTQRLEFSDNELNDATTNLCDAQRQLKE